MKQTYRVLTAITLWLGWSLQLFAQSDQAVLLGPVSEIKAAFKAKASQANARSRSAMDNQITHNLPGQAPLVITIQSSKQEGEAETFYGDVNASSNSRFHLRIVGDVAAGSILLLDERKLFRYVSTNQRLVYLQEEDIDSVLCVGYQKAPDTLLPPPEEAGPGITSLPELESLPGAEAVVFLDFDGHRVTNTLWNYSFTNGEPIEAAPANLSVGEMLVTWKIMSEDFRPFDLNVTTSEAVFNKAPANRRMRVIFSPTNYFYPGWGGAAYIGSFTWGSSFYGETPCWVWNSFFGKYAGEAGSHEVGHTLNLLHDGTTSPPEEYYFGHNNWAPIMGAGYYVPVVQWSRGDYPNANNFEDDLSIMASFHGFGFRPDDHGNTNERATPLDVDETGYLSGKGNKGIITTRHDVDVFSFTTTGSTINLTVNPEPDHPNLDVLLTLKNDENAVIAQADEQGMGATITHTLPAGTYYLHIEGTRGSLGAPSDYASLGEYNISGSLHHTTEPVITITAPQNGETFTAPATIQITTAYSESYPDLVTVEFYEGDNFLGEDRTAPYTFTWHGVKEGNYTITARAIDPRNGVVGIASVTIHVLPGLASGSITRELWMGVHGAGISAIPLHTRPTSVDELELFEAPTNIADNYGQRIRGFVQAPETGEYTFWIAADDVAELWLSTSEGPADKQKIARVDRWTYPREWTKYEAQQSGKILLEAGRRYYIEALHKEQGGGDNLAVGWELPSGVQERPIKGNRLAPYDGTGTITQELWSGVHGADISNIPLSSSPTSVSELNLFEAPANLADNYGQRLRGFVKAPATGEYLFWIAADDVAELWLSTSEDPAKKRKIAQVDRWTDQRQWAKYNSQQSVAIHLEAGQRYYIEALHKEQGGSDHLAVGWQLPDGSLERPIGGNRLMPYDGTGTITHAFWASVHGNDITSIPLDREPTRRSELSLFETPTNLGDNYGQQVRGYVSAPETGPYTFWIAADDVAELWLSTSEDPASKQKIAQVDRWTYPGEWTKYDAQQSAEIMLQAGRRYYIEALHKERGGSDHLAVGWQLPAGDLERPIGGRRLMPYEFSPGVDPFMAVTNVLALNIEMITVFPNPVAAGGVLQVALEGIYAEVQLTFFDLSTGKTLLTKDFQEGQQLQLRLPDITRGLYGIKIVTADKSWTSKVVVH